MTNSSYPSLMLIKSCAHCGVKDSQETPLFKCVSCGMAWYCGMQHQEFDWKKHKPRCRTVQSKNQAKSADSPSLPLIEFPINSNMSQVPSTTCLGSQETKCINSHDTTITTAPLLVGTEAPIPLTHAGNRPEFHPLMPGRRTTFFVPQTHHEVETTDCFTITTITTSVPSAFHSSSQPNELQLISALAGIKPVFSLPALNRPKEEKKDHSKNTPYEVSVQQHLLYCITANPRMNRYEAFCLRVHDITLHAAERLREFGWCTVDHFLGDEHCVAVLNDVQQLYQKGIFHEGRLVKDKEGIPAKNIRSDEIYWYDGDNSVVNIKFLLGMFDSVVVQLATHLAPHRVNGRSRAMIACYPANATRYVQHVDNPAKDGRLITVLYYVNQNWKPEHGGSLRLYPTSSTKAVEIEPLFDRLVLFWSDKRNPHEVLPTYRHRFAITTWYFDELERKAEATARKQQHVNKDRGDQPEKIINQSKNSISIALPVSNERLAIPLSNKRKYSSEVFVIPSRASSEISLSSSLSSSAVSSKRPRTSHYQNLPPLSSDRGFHGCFPSNVSNFHSSSSINMASDDSGIASGPSAGAPSVNPKQMTEVPALKSMDDLSKNNPSL